MNKENIKGAASLRRSAIAERIRLKEEWSALKEIDVPATTASNLLKKKPVNSRRTPHASGRKKKETEATSKKKIELTPPAREALTGVVALVDVGSEDRALPLRAVLTALGATVVREWSPLVTHLIWTDNGDRCIRARARALACKLVSPLWVEACAAAAKKLSEKLFPAATRHSDLPSPKRLRMLLKKAERENVPLEHLLSDSIDNEEENMQCLKLVTSSDTSAEKTTDVSEDTTDIESRVNTECRHGRATTRSTTTTTTTTTTSGTDKERAPPPKSRRKLFTCKEVQDLTSSDDENGSDTRSKSRPHQNKLTQVEKRDLARAERMAKKLLAACNTENNNNNVIATSQGFKPRIVLTGMSRHERKVITKCIEGLGGIVQNGVNKRTTHVLLGACRTVLSTPCSHHSSDISGVSRHCDLSKSSCWTDATDARARTLQALWGAAVGARLLHARWALRSAELGRWLPHHDFVVQHLRKIAQKARIERVALHHVNCDYAYDVFSGIRVVVTEDAEQKEAAKQLLKICGACVVPNDQRNSSKVEVVVGKEVGEVHSKWVFDSVASARVRTTRKYINMNNASHKGKHCHR